MVHYRNNFKFLRLSGIIISVRLILTLLGVAFIGVFQVPAAHAAHTQARLILASDTARPGDTIMAGVHLHMEPRWHTYWRNPGSSGIATRITWTLPPGVTAGETQWPVPRKLLIEGLTTYVYEDDVVLLVPLTISPNVAPGPLDLKGKSSWLECDTSCIPGKSDIQATLTIGSETKPSPDAALIQAWLKKLPQPQVNSAAKASWDEPATTNSRPLVLEWSATGSPQSADFIPYGSDNIEVSGKTEPLSSDSGMVRLKKQITKSDGDWPDKISGLLVHQSNGEPVAQDVTLPISSPAQASEAAPAHPAAVPTIPLSTGSDSLFVNLLLAFLGGLILNVMPCVLPVISLKILGFVNQAKSNPRQVKMFGLLYSAGVLVSFLVLASLVVAAKTAGHHIGWGFQFSSPQFIVIFTVVVTLVALNLFGLFEVNPGAKVMNTAGHLAAKEGAAGAFFNGIVATLLATSCSAAYLAPAIAFAFRQSSPVIILFFLVIGLGLSAPYLILTWNPAWLKILPKPGAWMEKFKIAMGFPMLATAVWLFHLTTVYYGNRVFWLGLFLVMVALAAWIYGEFVQRGRTRKGFALIVVLLILAGGYGYAIEGQLRWRSPIMDVAVGAPKNNDPDGIDWQRWSPEAVAEARAAGRPVLVDFTADWCTTCQVNKKTSLEVTKVQKKLKEINAVALVGDYTKFPDNITIELNNFGRAAVPLVLIYPGNPNVPPEVLPDGFLTPGIVMDALDKAARQPSSASTASVR
ncbi:MAG: dsbD [Pedosphaera sp.]|nr:dsbD [Pedosphaera sp.]